MEGYDADFDPPLEKRLECPICLLAQREPMQTPCGHRFCAACINRAIQMTGPKCPVDNQRLRPNQLFPDAFARREVLSLNVNCSHKEDGCTWHGELRSLKIHQKECDYEVISCENMCGFSDERAQLLAHHLDVCPHRLELCHLCGLLVQFDLKPTHEGVCAPLYSRGVQEGPPAGHKIVWTGDFLLRRRDGTLPVDLPCHLHIKRDGQLNTKHWPSTLSLDIVSKQLVKNSDLVDSQTIGVYFSRGSELSIVDLFRGLHRKIGLVQVRSERVAIHMIMVWNSEEKSFQCCMPRDQKAFYRHLKVAFSPLEYIGLDTSPGSRSVLQPQSSVANMPLDDFGGVSRIPVQLYPREDVMPHIVNASEMSASATRLGGTSSLRIAGSAFHRIQPVQQTAAPVDMTTGRDLHTFAGEQGLAAVAQVPHQVVQFQPHHPALAAAIAMPTSPTVSLRQPAPLQSFSIGTLQPIGAATSSSAAVVPIVGVTPPPLMYTPAVAATAGVALPMAAHATSTPLLQSTYEAESRVSTDRSHPYINVEGRRFRRLRPLRQSVGRYYAYQPLQTATTQQYQDIGHTPFWPGSEVTPSGVGEASQGVMVGIAQSDDFVEPQTGENLLDPVVANDVLHLDIGEGEQMYGIHEINMDPMTSARQIGPPSPNSMVNVSPLLDDNSPESMILVQSGSASDNEAGQIDVLPSIA